MISINFSILILGFVSGLPFLLTLSTLSFWLAEAHVSNTTIGMFMLLSLPYSLKFLWAPLIDYCKIPYLSKKLGHRRSWALVLQIGLIAAIVFLGYSDPAHSIWQTAIAALFVAFFSASQDIVIDAYRIEMINTDNRGALAALETVGFRFGMLASGAGALYLASIFDWQTAYHIMAGAVLVGVVTVLCMPNPIDEKIVHVSFDNEYKKHWRSRFNAIFLRPLAQFPYKNQLCYLLLFIFCFKMGDTVLNAMSAPFLCDIGFSKIEFANVSKVLGISLMVVGCVLGGIMIKQLGNLQSVIICSVLQALSCLMFTIQALVGYDYYVLVITVGIESLCSGMASSVFIAYLSTFCLKPHTATHFTLLYSFGSFSRVIISSIAGWLADHLAWSVLFLLTATIFVPTIFFVFKIAIDSSPASKSTSKRIYRVA